MNYKDWQVTITNRVNNGTTDAITFRFFNSVTGQVIPNHVANGFTSDDQIERYAFNQIKAYTDVGNITIQTNDTLDLSTFLPADPVIPTQDELDAKEWIINYSKLLKQQKASSQDLPVDAKSLTDLAILVKSTFKPEYTQYLGV